ncbi:hypothetical protein M0812_02440 [Anaeramoeba flamelloides]|uniref:Uncharacterized protein n=1 Tax=Anaeramoeba flamelloides TaxID=1746091 RepID=A0AAV7YLX0_9EUKA|nr:hypothetical protein M0812_02440 [Anaeramoeba flamelloides]
MKKKFRHNEDQIIRQKSLENGNEPLKPTIYSELLTPHSNYLVDSKQMILLLNNLHCPFGRRKELEELKENYGSFSAILNCKNCPIKQYKDNKETFYFSNKIEGMGSRKGSDTKNKARFRTENGQRKIISSVLAGNFYENYREQMEMLGVYYLKKNAYYKTIDILQTKTLNINKGEFNGDIELFTEVDESNEIIGFVEEDLQKEDSYNENDIEEIEEILTSGRNIIPDLMDDDVFGISFDKKITHFFY